MKKGDVGMTKHFSKSMETRDEFSTTCNLKVMLRCLSALMLHPTSLPQEQAAKTKMLSVVRIQFFMHS